MKTSSIAAAVALCAVPVASPALAQGTAGTFKKPFATAGCPTGYKSADARGARDYCDPESKTPPRVFPRRSTSDQCPQGYYGYSNYCVEGSRDHTPAADKLASYGTITKANRLDRCPLGYFSKSDMSVCTTRLSPAPKSRKKVGACKPGEIDEWGLYCTADPNLITRAQAEQEADRDFNAIYTANGAQGPRQTPSGDDVYDSAPMVAAYGRKGSTSPAPSGGESASSASNGATPAAQGSTACPSGSAAGAAIGGALAGQGGAALGGMLGGLGRKKRQGC